MSQSVEPHSADHEPLDAHALEHWVNGPCRVVGSEIVTWKLKKTKNQKRFG